jgi:putative transposase
MQRRETNGKHHDRRHPVHGVRIQSTGPTIVLLTVCTKDRVPWLATPANHQLLRAIWSEATAWRVGHYVLMPDHLHLLAAPGEPHLPLENWVQYWKSQFSKHHRAPDHCWQTDHWDRRLRDGESYAEKWDYVRNNPVRHGLLGEAKDWPYFGKIFDLEW